MINKTTKLPLSLINAELQKLFEKCEAERSHLDTRWEDYAGYTLPYMHPTEEYHSTTEMQHDYQSMGAQAVNHLANKIVSTLFTPGRSFFRIDATEQMYLDLERDLGLKRPEVNSMMATAEKQAMREHEAVSLRTANLHAIKSLIINGNGLIYFPTEKQAKAQSYSLKDYVVKRDMSGVWHTLIMRDNHVVNTLPEDLQRMAINQGLKDEDEVVIYTGVFRTSEGKYITKQEINDLFVIPRKKGINSVDNVPWIPLVWNHVRGYDYGPGLVEEMSGDFHALSNLSEAVLNLASIASDIKILVDPMGQTDVDALNNADPGTYVYGHLDDVGYLTMDAKAQLNFLEHQIEMYTRRIGQAFLLNTAVTRDAERVTAEEIRMQASELEESLGGVYSRLAEDMQQPQARRLLDRLNPGFNAADVVILTGVESLSRNTELDQMRLFFRDIAELSAMPEEVLGRLKIGNIISDLGAARQIEYKKYVMTDDEVAEKQAAQQEAQQQEQMGEAVASGVGQQIAQPQQ